MTCAAAGGVVLEAGDEILDVTDLAPVPDMDEIEAIAWHTPGTLADRMRRDPDRYTDSIKLIFPAYLKSNLMRSKPA